MSQIPQKIEARLKENDVSILLGLAEGLSMKEIATTMDVGSRQIESRVFWLRRIFDARTTTQLVAEAYHYGILRSPH
jgi:DNA-binding NarL/FixJ family response regulator